MQLTLVLVVILLIAGCATAPPPLPPELQYVAPVDQALSLPTLSGSQVDSTLFDDFTAYVLAVDGKRVMTGRTGWSTALRIRLGWRNITVAFQRGAWSTQADLTLQAVAGAKYQVRFSTDVQVYGANTYCDFWIIDVDSKTPVTGIQRGLIGSGGQAPPVFIPIPAG